MAQFECEICGTVFDRESEYARHVVTSHPPPPSPTSADLAALLKSLTFPLHQRDLEKIARERGGEEMARVFEQLPEEEFKDAMDVVRAFDTGAAPAQQSTATRPPQSGSREKSGEVPSAALMVSTLAGIEFPATDRQLKQYAEKRAGKGGAPWMDSLDDRVYRDMAEVMKSLGKNLDGKSY